VTGNLYPVLYPESDTSSHSIRLSSFGIAVVTEATMMLIVLTVKMIFAIDTVKTIAAANRGRTNVFGVIRMTQAVLPIMSDIGLMEMNPLEFASLSLSDKCSHLKLDSYNLN
jgi:hypothetical protein